MYQPETTSSQWNSIINHEQAGKSRASFHMLSSVNLDIPLETVIFTDDKRKLSDKENVTPD